MCSLTIHFVHTVVGLIVHIDLYEDGVRDQNYDITRLIF